MQVFIILCLLGTVCLQNCYGYYWNYWNSNDNHHHHSHSHSSHSHSHSEWFICEYSRQSVHESRVCDGYYDCDDGSDEDNCGHYNHHHQSSHHNHHCLETEFQCHTHYGASCIPSHYLCDKYDDCIDGRDEREENCECDEDERFCEIHYTGHGFCVPLHVSCDSYYNDYFYGSSHNNWWYGRGIYSNRGYGHH